MYGDNHHTHGDARANPAAFLICPQASYDNTLSFSFGRDAGIYGYFRSRNSDSNS